MKIPERQAQLDALTRKHLTKPEPRAEANSHKAADTAAFAHFTDEEVLGLCRKARNAAKFSDLNDAGDAATYGGDESRADLGLMGMYAFYTQDRAQLERLFGASALGQRDKWRNRPDYRRRTIDKALKRLGETYTPARSRSRSLGTTGMSNGNDHDLNRSFQALSFSGREKPGPREWLADNILWKGHATSWFGEGGVAKSLLGLHFGLTLAEARLRYWMGFAVKTVPVLYLDFELDADEQHRRSLELAAGMDLDNIPEDFYYLSVSGIPPREAFETAAQECRRLGVGLIIVDSVGFALEGDSESARDVLGFYRECVQPLKEAGATPLLIDHQAKIIKGEKYSDKQAFGSVYKTNAVRSSFQVRGSWEDGAVSTTFTHKKNNFGQKEEDFTLKVSFGDGRIEVERLAQAEPNPDREPSKKEQVFMAVEDLGRATAETVARKTGFALSTVRNSISELVAEGALVDTGDKQGRSRIVVTHSQSTQGTGTGTTAKVGDFEECPHGVMGGCEACR